MYPFCVIDDVQALNSQRDTYSASTKPTSTQVTKFMLEITSQMMGIIDKSGYDIDNLHSVSDTATAITAGDGATIAVTDGTQFSVGDIIKIEGVTSGVRDWEFTDITAISTNDLTADASNSYDTGASIIVVNHALNTLRRINAWGAAWLAEESCFMMANVGESDHSEKLMLWYHGSEDTRGGLWAIENIPGYLVGATTDSDAKVVRSLPYSYTYENSSDDDCEADFEKDMTF